MILRNKVRTAGKDLGLINLGMLDKAMKRNKKAHPVLTKLFLLSTTHRIKYKMISYLFIQLQLLHTPTCSLYSKHKKWLTGLPRHNAFSHPRPETLHFPFLKCPLLCTHVAFLYGISKVTSFVFPKHIAFITLYY